MTFMAGQFPQRRMRRNRTDGWNRRLVREATLSTDDLILPLFVQEGKAIQTEIASMPGVARLSADILLKKAEAACRAGIPAVALFPVVEEAKKSLLAEEAVSADNLVCRMVRLLKKELPELGVICDVALDPYTSHGQDGLMENGIICNDATVSVLQQQARVLAEAGCDIVAPSDMMDGRVGAIRHMLEKEGLHATRILAYSAKYASHFYGPFREAVGSAANLGKADKRTYQMDPANGDEALHEAWLDVQEGADMVMVKPGLPYLDIIHRLKTALKVPVFAYQVSGEYAMLKAAAGNGWLSWPDALMETMLAFKRSGASAILTYAALEVADILHQKGE